MITAGAYEMAEMQLMDVARRICHAASSAAVPIRVVGGLAAFLYVDDREPIAARLTPEVEIAIRNSDLDRLRAAAERHGFTFRGNAFHLSDSGPRSSVRLVFAEHGDSARLRELPVATIADLVCLELTSFRLNNKLHIQDLDGVGLITPEIEACLSPLLRDRLAEVRATE
ncbi:MAG: hypothetical protein ABIR70_14310 [Bryobacteraceae bacterium]